MARAQSAPKTARVGWLGWAGAGTTASPVPLAAFRAGMAERGWSESRNLHIEVRTGDQTTSRTLATQLVQSKVDVIVAQGPMVFGARAVAGFLPIVFSINGDPVEANLVASLSRPGANLTGITALSDELAVKRLQLIKEAVPSAKRIAAIANQAHPGVAIEQAATLSAAEALGVRLDWFAVRAAGELPAALEAIGASPAQALVAIPDTLVNREAAAIADFCARRRLGAISGWAEFAEAGNLMSYGPNLHGFYRLVASYTDRLLRGSRPADLAVERPTQFELVVNLKAARVADLRVSQPLLLRADRVIE